MAYSDWDPNIGRYFSPIENPGRSSLRDNPFYSPSQAQLDAFGASGWYPRGYSARPFTPVQQGFEQAGNGLPVNSPTSLTDPLQAFENDDWDPTYDDGWTALENSTSPAKPGMEAMDKVAMGLVGLGVPGAGLAMTAADVMGRQARNPQAGLFDSIIDSVMGTTDNLAPNAMDWVDYNDAKDLGTDPGRSGTGFDRGRDDTTSHPDTASKEYGSLAEWADALSEGFGQSADSDAGEADCVISTALNDTGSWSRREKLVAVNWCRKTHHDGSKRGRIWVDGYHQWGRVVAKYARRYTWFRRLTKHLSAAFVNQATGRKKTVLGFLVKWVWAQPLSYGCGLVRSLRS